jgi:hypothetical protein
MHDSEKTLEDIAVWLHKSPHTLRAEVNPNQAAAKLGFQDVVAATVYTQNLVALNAFAAEMNCILIALPDDEKEPSKLDVPGLMRSFAEFIDRTAIEGKVSTNDLASAEEAAAALLGNVQRTLKCMAGASAMTRSFDSWVPA